MTLTFEQSHGGNGRRRRRVATLLVASAAVLALAVPAARASFHTVDGTLNVSVVDSRFDPPQVVNQRSVKGNRLRWLRAGTRDGLFRYEIAVDVVDRGKETAYLLRVRRGFDPVRRNPAEGPIA